MCTQCANPSVYCKGLCATCYHRQYREANRARLAEKKHANYVAACSTCQGCGGKTGRPDAQYCRTCYLLGKTARAETPGAIAERTENRRARNYRWREKNKDRWPNYSNARRARLLQADEGLTAEVWNMMLRWYAGKCVYCMGPAEPLEQDHVVPLSQGGKHSMYNVVPACKACNRKKGTGYMEVQHPIYYLLNSTTPA